MKKYIITSIIIIAISSLGLGQNSRMGSASSTQLLVVVLSTYLVVALLQQLPEWTLHFGTLQGLP